MNIIDLHSHHLPSVSGTAIVNVPLAQWAPQSGEWYSVAIHPWEDADENDLSVLAETIIHRQVLSVGEAGLDKLKGSSRQRELFIAQIRLSEAFEKPLILHCVKAEEELLAIKKEMRPLQPWILHGFRGKPQQAEQWLRAGISLSVGVRFNPESLRVIPLDQLFLESDENSEDIQFHYEHTAHLLHLTAQRLREQVKKNIDRVFFKNRIIG